MNRTILLVSLLAVFAHGGSSSVANAQSPLLTYDLHRMIPADNDFSEDVALGDVDGDGDLDALVANHFRPFPPCSRCKLYLNVGAGVLVDASGRLPGMEAFARSVALGDVDGDGDLDAVLGNNGTNHLYLNDGTGCFADASWNLPEIAADTAAVALADVDGDGDLDLFCGNGFDAKEQNRLYLNDGTGLFSDATPQLPDQQEETTDMAFGDVDNDGDLDVFVANGPGGGLFGTPDRLYLNDGTGLFIEAPIATAAQVTHSVALGDVDGDGDLDVLLGRKSLKGTPNHLFLNDGSGAFTNGSALLPADTGSTRTVVLADADGDGDLDAFIGKADFNTGAGLQNRLFLNSGTGSFSDATAWLPQRNDWTTALAPGDIDGDGDIDLVTANSEKESGFSFYTGMQNHLDINDGRGHFVDSFLQLPAEREDTSCLALGDVDGDGDIDLLAGSSKSTEADRLYLNDGTGFFHDASERIPQSGDRSYDLAFGDVDNDGDLDVLISATPDDHLYLNDGTGAFVDASSQLPALGSETSLLALGDMDGDGDLDAVLCGTGRSYLFVNDGAGAFSSRIFATAGSQPHSLALGDVDGDGDLDVLEGMYKAQNRLYLNDGAGSFADGTSRLPADSDWTLAVALGDMDGDGDLDAVLGNRADGSASGQTRLYINNGSGYFTDAQVAVDEDITSALALGDLDGDGDLDVLVLNRGDEAMRNRLYINDGSGRFFGGTARLPAIRDASGPVALGDLDGDGDLDAVIGNSRRRQNRVLTNLTHQLAWRGLPRIGKDLVMELFGPPAGWFTLAVSKRPAQIPYPPFGMILIDPTAAFGRRTGFLNAEGRASAAYRIPSNPSLVGTSLYWQAATGPPVRLSNLEITSLTGW